MSYNRSTAGAVRALLMACAVAPLCVAGSPALAQADTAAPNPEDIVVTGSRERFRPDVTYTSTKLPLDLVETPQSVTVLSADFIKVAGLRNVSDLANYSAGVSRAGSADGIGGNLNIRGFEVNRRSGGYRLNGVVYPSDVPLDFAVIERIEILKGPSSIVAGAVDYAGTVNILTKAPSMKAGYSVLGEVGADSHFRGIVDATGPLAGDDIAYRVIGVAQDAGTFIDFTRDQRFVLAPSMLVRLGSSTQLDLTLVYQSLKLRPTDGFSVLADNSLPKPATTNFFGALYNDYRQTSLMGSAVLTHRFSEEWQLRLSGGYGRQTQRGNSTYLYGDAEPETGVRGDQYLYNFGETFLGGEDLSGEAVVMGETTVGGLKQQLVLAAEVRRNVQRLKEYQEQFAGIINIFTNEGRDLPFQDANLLEPQQFERLTAVRLGFSGIAVLRPVERVTILAGIRREGERQTARQTDDEGLLLGSQSYDTQWKTLPRAGLVFEILPGFNIYGSYSKGVLFQPGLQDRDGRPLPPETGTQWEGGLKATPFDGRLMLGLSAYQIQRANVSVLDNSVPGFDAFTVIRGGRHRGVEFEAIGEPVLGLNIIATYAYSEVQITEADNPDQIGQRLPNVPTHAASLFATYELQNGPLKGLSLGGGLAHVGDREADFVGTTTLPAYTRLDLRLAYLGLDDWTFAFNVENVGNARIYSSSYGDTQFGIRYESGRTARLLVERRF